jgi:hypothetical protein
MPDLPRQSRGRRWVRVELSTGSWWWCAWRLFERVEGVTPTERDAEEATDHFLRASSTYSLRPRAAR